MELNEFAGWLLTPFVVLIIWPLFTAVWLYNGIRYNEWRQP